MKKILLLLFLLISCICNASNLEFSQVLLIQSPGNSSFSQTVPTGKVWEIKSMTQLSVNNGGDFKINGVDVTLVDNFSVALNILPFWLPAGSVLTGWGGAAISIIEYNIVP